MRMKIMRRNIEKEGKVFSKNSRLFEKFIETRDFIIEEPSIMIIRIGKIADWFRISTFEIESDENFIQRNLFC